MTPGVSRVTAEKDVGGESACRQVIRKVAPKLPLRQSIR
jgi:hypothetical protein